MAPARRRRAKEIEQLRKVIALAPTFARGHLALGKALLHDGKVPEAIEALQEAARLEPNRGEANYQLGLALARAGRKEEAAAALQKGRELVAADDSIQNAEPRRRGGAGRAREGRFRAQAEAKFRHALQLVPDSCDRSDIWGWSSRSGRRPGARAASRKALELNPADLAAEAGLERCRRCVRQKHPRRPSTPPWTSRPDGRARGDIRRGEVQEVEPLLGEYVKEHPRSSWGWYALGYSQFAQQKIGDSIKALAKSLELDVTNAEAHKILGRNLMIIGRFDAAQVEFEQALRYKPDSAESAYNLGKLFSIQDNWEPARKAVRSGAAHRSLYLEAIDALGFALEALGDDPARSRPTRRRSR